MIFLETGKRATIKDVAKLANVTSQTVSRALRNSPNVAPETKRAVMRAAEQLNYVRNSTATALRNGSSKIICVIYDNLLNFYFSIMTDFIQYRLREKGYSVLTLSLRNSRLNNEAYLTAISYNVDGIISFLEPETGLSEEVKKYRIPVLLMGRRTDEPEVDCLFADDVHGGELAAERLIENGCENLLCVTEPLELSCASDRVNGFLGRVEKFRKDTGADIKAGVSIYNSRASESAAGYVCEQYDGIFCFNDMLALEVISNFEECGKNPPSIIGYDNIQNEISLPRRLTSVGCDKMVMAEKAVNMLTRRISEPSLPRQNEKLPVYLTEGVTVLQKF